MSYQEALKYFQQADFTAALALCSQVDLHRTQDKQSKRLQADCLLELKEAMKASLLYEELGLYNQAAYAAILNQDLNRATKLISKASYSPARKWVQFLLEFLPSGDALDLASPGYLTLRLYSEATIGYFLTYDLKNYFAKFIKHRNELAQVYPEIIKDIGSAYLARKEYKSALVLLEEAKAKFCEDAGIHFKSASAYFGLNQPEKAKQFLATVAKMLPGSTLIKNLLGRD